VAVKLNNINLILVFAFIFLQTWSLEVFAEQWFYIDPIRPSDSITLQSNPSAFEVNDLFRAAVICDEKSNYICIVTEGFYFYVPKNLTKTVKRWNINGIEYKSHIEERILIFGILEEIYLIDRKEGNGTIRYLYSKKRGLIGIGGFTEKSSSLFLLSSYCGFGAPETCKP
jgi:hypothetical protein